MQSSSCQNLSQSHERTSEEFIPAFQLHNYLKCLPVVLSWNMHIFPRTMAVVFSSLCTEDRLRTSTRDHELYWMLAVKTQVSLLWSKSLIQNTYYLKVKTNVFLKVTTTVVKFFRSLQHSLYLWYDLYTNTYRRFNDRIRVTTLPIIYIDGVYCSYDTFVTPSQNVLQSQCVQ